mmetsp:Transcript_553/g.738  ORF Transcript_553/g.738 Transcript_553/m.738 type:complete len:272 (+) Transcript_553:881-1696(+)
MLRVIRLLKLLRVLKASLIYQRFEATLSLPTRTILLSKHVMYLIIFGHWTACLWIMSANLQDYETITWIDAFGSNFYGADGSENGQWRFNCETNCEDKYNSNEAAEECSANCNVLTPLEIYSGSCYWAIVSITSVGYGDITPQNATEMLLTTVYLLAAAFFWAWIIGVMSTIGATSDPAAIEHKQTMDLLNTFMDEKSFPEALRRHFSKIVILRLCCCRAKREIFPRITRVIVVHSHVYFYKQEREYHVSGNGLFRFLSGGYVCTSITQKT